MKRSILFASAMLGVALVSTRALAAPGPEIVAWVYFHDKAAANKAVPLNVVSERSLRRRAKVRPANALVDAADLPLDEAAVARVAAQITAVRQRSRWLNAVSVRATAAQLAAVAELPEVRRVEPVARYRRRAAEEAPVEAPPSPPPSRQRRTTGLDYGASLGQLQLLNVPPLHAQGLTGAGVLIAHCDNGYRLLSHTALAATQVVATHDFVDGDTDPAPPAGSPSGWGAHGISTLSTLSGFAPGELIGVAYEASYALARTENDASETPLEEDNWIAAIEWADSLGADVASTSLGYLDYDPPFTSWTWEDMDGNTAAITIAADLAVERGIVVVNSAGNAGEAEHNTLLAPADGDLVLTVGAIDAAGERASFSSVGPTTDVPARFKPDVMAPGVLVHVARTMSVDHYGNSSGTSLSCPLTSGVVALLLQAHPNATPAQIHAALRSTADNASSPDNLRGWGTVNAVAALGWLQASDSEPPTATAPLAWRLAPAAPNPFNPTTRIEYVVARPTLVTLRILDPRGRAVRTLVQEAQRAGEQAVRWNGTGDDGRRVASGVYLARLDALDGSQRTLYSATRKLVLAK